MTLQVEWNGYSIEIHPSTELVFIRVVDVAQTGTQLDVDEIWSAYLSSSEYQNSQLSSMALTDYTLQRVYGSDGDDLITKYGAGGLFGNSGDDTFVMTAVNGTGQFHSYGQAGDDITIMTFDQITTFSHGHHVRGHTGSDVFKFENTTNVKSLVVGRIEDFNFSSDTLYVDGELIDFNDLPAHIDLIRYNGAHNDAGADDQLWLRIKTAVGGIILYTLEGARIDMDNDSVSHDQSQEPHFVPIEDGLEFGSLEAVKFEDLFNYVPDGFTPKGGILIEDVDEIAADVREVIEGTVGGDVIAAGINDDIVEAKSGDDHIWGGSGHDEIYGGSGDDIVQGNFGDDTLYGGNGDDFVIGNYGDDFINGGSGTDFIQGGLGDDVIDGGADEDIIDAGLGDDHVDGGADDDVITNVGGDDIIYGGSGDDVIVILSGKNRAYGEGGNDQIFGGSGSDILSGGTGDDLLVGDNFGSMFFGNDTLIAGDGDDIIMGLGGADTFVFLPNEGNNTIAQFAHSDISIDQLINDFEAGVDTLDLSGFAAVNSENIETYLTEINGNVVFAAEGTQVTLIDTNLSEMLLYEDNFLF